MMIDAVKCVGYMLVISSVAMLVASGVSFVQGGGCREQRGWEWQGYEWGGWTRLSSENWPMFLHII